MKYRLHEVLELTRPLVGVDLETCNGGPAKENGIVQVALEIMVPGQPVKDWSRRVNPNRPISRKAFEKHGISDEMVKDLPTFKQFAANLIQGLSNCDFVGTNLGKFDLPLLQEEFSRAGYLFVYEDAALLDSYRLWQVLQPRTLTDAVNQWLDEDDREENHAHDAGWDVRMSSRVVANQVVKRDLPKTVRALHDLQWPDQFDVDGRLRWIDGKLCLAFGAHKDKPIRDVPDGYLQWMIKGGFSDKVKRVVQNALAGRYEPDRETA